MQNEAEARGAGRRSRGLAGRAYLHRVYTELPTWTMYRGKRT